MSTSLESSPSKTEEKEGVDSNGSHKRMSFKSMLGSMFSSGDEDTKKKRLEEADAAREEKKKAMEEKKKEVKAKAKELAGTERAKASSAAAQSPGSSRSLFAKGKLRRASANRRMSLQKLQEVDSTTINRAAELIVRVEERYQHSDRELDILTSVMASLLKENPAVANRIVALAEPDTQEGGAPMPKKVEETKQKKQRGSKSRDEESEPESESGSEPESSEPESEGSDPSGNHMHSNSHRSSQSVQFSGQDQIKEFDVDRSESSEPESEPGSEPEGDPEKAVWRESATTEALYGGEQENQAYYAAGGGQTEAPYQDDDYAEQHVSEREQYYDDGAGDTEYNGGRTGLPPPPTRRAPPVVNSSEAKYASRRSSVVKMASATGLGHGEDIVGLRIMVLGGDDWYEGVVVSFNPEDHLHLIVFPDGAEAVLDLSVEEWRLEETA